MHQYRHFNPQHFFPQPSAPDEFELGNDGNIRLKKHLNFNVAESHIFTVEAKVKIYSLAAFPPYQKSQK